MSRKYFKQFPVVTMKAEKGSRVRKGIAAVFGNVDSWGDRIHEGAFSKTISEGRNRFKHLWNHDFWSPPIAKILDIKEVGKDELPDAVLEKSPEATGGLMVSREYLEGVPLADWVLKAIDAGEINEMSIGYDIIQSEETEESIGDKSVKIHELKELKLYDTSDVNWGMNSATVADGAKAGVPALPIGLIATKFNEALGSDRDLTEDEERLVWQIVTKGLSHFQLPFDIANGAQDGSPEPDPEPETKSEDANDDAEPEPPASTPLSDSFLELPIPKI